MSYISIFESVGIKVTFDTRTMSFLQVWIIAEIVGLGFCCCMIESAKNDACTATNPRPVTDEDIKRILSRVK